MTEQPAQLGDDLVWAEALSPARRAPALFLDRDGVVVEEVHFLHDPAQLRLIAGAGAAIRRANQAGVHAVLVTNQSGIGRGRYGWEAFAVVQQRLQAELAAADARLDAVLACPFHPDGVAPYCHPDHPARKPNPGMLLRAAGLLDIDLAVSWIIGDRDVDVAAGRAAGLAGAVHVATGYGAVHRPPALALAEPGFTVLAADSIAEVVRLVPLLRG